MIQQRTNAIAELLVAKPAGFGRPAADREVWEKFAAAAAYRKVVPRAEKILKTPLPDLPDDLYLDYSRTGNRSRWQARNSKRRGRLRPLVLAECIENKGRFVPGLEELIRELSKERTWVMPAHDWSLANFKKTRIDIDLASAALAWELATADWLLGDKLSPATRKLIRSEIRRRVWDPYRRMLSGKRKCNWWMHTTNNWNAVCLAGVTGSALALIESREDRALFVAAAEKYSKNFLRGFAADGYCTEGVGYWNYGFGHYVLLSEAIYQATDGRLDLLAGKNVRAPAAFPLGIEITGGVYPAFADCSVTARPDARLLDFVCKRFGLPVRTQRPRGKAALGGPLYAAMIHAFANSASGKSAAPPTDELPLRTWFENAGVLICRPSKGGTDFAVALKGGHNAEHHNHNDVGSYAVVVGGRPVLPDPGAEVYTARTFSARRYDSKVLNSWGHPVPVVAGQLQRAGHEARGRVVRVEHTSTSETLILDLASAYDVASLESLQRTFVYGREDGGSLAVSDDVRFKQPQAFGTALITLGTWKQTGPKTLTIRDGDAAVQVEIACTGGAFKIRAEKIREDVKTRKRPTRLGIELPGPVQRAMISVTIRPLGSP